KKLETLKLEKDGVDRKLAGLLKASKDLDNLIESQRPSPTVESTSRDDKIINSSTSENGESTDSILSKFAVKFVKAAKRSTTNKVETIKKPSVRYVELYRKPSKKYTVRGNQQNLNNLKSQQLEKDGVDGKLAGLLKASKDLDNLIESQRPSPTIESTSGDDQNRNSYTFENGESTDSILSKSAAKFVKAAERPYIPPMRTTRPNTNAATRPYVNSARPQTTQELMIILIQRVQRLKKELKARTPIHKVDRGRSRSAMAWVPKKKLDCRCNIKFRGGMLGIKCSKIFPLLVMNSHCKKKFPLLEEVPTARVILPLLVQKSSYC
nr:hypothetical protein [Tanacetum cinerariifolium]